MIRITAQAITGISGKPLYGIGKGYNWDLNDLPVDNMGERISAWDRQVSFDRDANFGDAFDIPKYNLLATMIHAEEKIDLREPIGLYVCGKIKELRIPKKGNRKERAFRMVGNKYYGERS
jgi:hypothetical protein